MKISDRQLKQIYAHAQETYPAEGCGFLLGSVENGGLVRQVRPAINQNRERSDRFIISAEEFAQVQLAADETGLDIIGIYHSHPDWPAIPSQTDMDNAWEEVYYLIVSVHEGKPFQTQIWQLADDEPRRFKEVGLEIVDEKA
jgi:proteasome lid subunit RPN8/RPN11